MSIFIDSANLDHIKSALDLGWVRGVTTNPLLLAKENMKGSIRLSEIKDLTFGPVFYQLMDETFEGMINEAHEAAKILEKQLVVKLPPSDLGFKVCSELSIKMNCCPTAIYSPAQALIASEAGAQYIAVYVNRATRLMGNGIQLVKDISTVLEGSRTELLAASIKSPGEAVNAITAGAQHLTLPYETLVQMSHHELSEDAIREFQKKGTGLSSMKTID